MVDLKWCSKCGAAMFGTYTHVCAPLWEVWEEDYHGGWDEATVVRGADAQAAAEKYAEEDDACGDYEIVGGRKAPRVRVRPQGDEGEGETYEVEGESIADYTARKIEKPKEEESDGR